MVANQNKLILVKKMQVSLVSHLIYLYEHDNISSVCNKCPVRSMALSGNNASEDSASH